MDKKQLMPQEIEVWYIIPAIRRELVKEIIKLGPNQKRIAEILGVTPAAVSQYMSQKRAKEVEFAQETMDEIKKSAKIIMDDPGKLVEEMQKILLSVKKNKTLCRVHYQHEKMPERCEACLAL